MANKPTKNNQELESLQEQIVRLKKQLESYKHSNDHFLKNKLFLHYDIKEPEQVVVDCETKLPVLAEVEKKKIQKGKESDPTHLIIEGDNYHSLSVLNYTHAGKIDLIYIDPPYNTGNKDFIYNDRFVDKEDSYRHSKWLSFMAHRLRLSKNLLADTGVIFISIDDNEQAHLRLLCDQIFGEENFVAQIIWEKKYSPQNDAKWFSDNHDYILVYAKSKELWRPNLLPRTDEMNARYKNPDKDPRGVWKASDLSVKTYSANYDYSITTPSGKIINPPRGRCWRTSKENFFELVNDNRVWFGPKGESVPAIKRFLSEVKQGMTPLTIWKYTEVGHNQTATQELKNIFGTINFTNPKPTTLIEQIIQIANKNVDATILDFFAGSGTTGHAVLKLNAQDGGTRQFILCTNNENNIAEDVTYPRIKKVIEGYGEGSNKTAGIPANLRYFQTAFVEKGKNNDQTRADLVARAVDMINVREATYEKVEVKEGYVLSRSTSTFTAIIFDSFKMADIWKEIEKKNTGVLPVKLYIFSFSDNTSAFTDMISKTTKLNWESKSIPEGILQVYQRLFKKKDK